MAANPPREQEQSIKDRKRQLYEDDDLPASSSADRKPFALYLRETPAKPLSAPVKAALWATAIVVGLLLAAAAMKSMQGKPPETAKPKARARAKARAEVIAPRIANPRFA